MVIPSFANFSSLIISFPLFQIYVMSIISIGFVCIGGLVVNLCGFVCR